MDRGDDSLSAVINALQRDLEELKTTQLRAREVLYPVGSIYMSATMSTVEEVQATFGGTWEAWGAGRVPVGVDSEDADFSTVESTGGEKTHTLTVDEMPSHQHRNIYAFNDGSGGDWSYRVTHPKTGTYTDGQSDGYAGGGQAHNNLQPYITCYMFKRIA